MRGVKDDCRRLCDVIQADRTSREERKLKKKTKTLCRYVFIFGVELVMSQEEVGFEHAARLTLFF